MEWKDVLDSGVAVVAFLAFLRLVFVDVAEIRARMSRLEEAQQRTNNLLARLVNAAEAIAFRHGVRLRKEEEA